VDKANETIGAAENLIGKLEGEYKRWSSQVNYSIVARLSVKANIKLQIWAGCRLLVTG